MLRTRIRRDLIKALAMYTTLCGLDSDSILEVSGNDVVFYEYIKNEWRAKEPVTQHECQEMINNAIRLNESERRELHEEYDRLVHELKWCFNPIREWRIYKDLKEVKIKIADLPSSKQVREEHEQHTWKELEWVQHSETYYQARAVWHVSCDSDSILDVCEDRKTVDEMQKFDNVNWSILIAMMTEPLDRKQKAVQAVIESCQKNHHDKGKWKVFLDSARDRKSVV